MTTMNDLPVKILGKVFLEVRHDSREFKLAFLKVCRTCKPGTVAVTNLFA